MGGVFQSVLLSQDGGVTINIRDSSGTGITSTLIGTKQSLDVNIANTSGPVAPGVAASQSDLAGLVYNAVAATGSTGQQAALQGDINFNLKTNDVNSSNIASKLSPANSAITAINVSTSSQVMLASNPNRKGLWAFNNSNQPAYIALAATSSLTLFSTRINPYSLLETDLGTYTGAVAIIFPATGTGQVYPTELS